MQQYIGFDLNGTEYTVPILKVIEIINMPAITRMPNSPSYVEGITNLRGKIIPVINLKRLAGLNNGCQSNASSAHESDCKVIVIASGKLTFGVIVDKITGVVAIEESSIEHPEGFLTNSYEHIEGVAKIKDRLTVLLNVKRLIPTDDISILEDIVLDVKDPDGDKVDVIKKVQTPEGYMDVKESYNIKDFLIKKGITSDDPKYIIFDEVMDFMNSIANQDYERADIAIQNIMSKSQSDLFKEVGRVTRKLHDSIRSFKEALDPKLRDMAITEMPSAIDKLQFVIDKTEDAANKTMSIVEKYILGMDELASHIRKLREPEESVSYIKNFKNNLEDDLTEILTAQSFQDITGQTIKKVIKLVSDMEDELIKLIATFGVKIDEGKKIEVTTSEKVSQEDVNELLKEFGF